jgi:hypothetical protein
MDVQLSPTTNAAVVCRFMAVLVKLCVIWEWGKLLNEELHKLCSPPNIIAAIKLWSMRWVGHVARAGRLEIRTKFWSENLKRKHYFGDSSSYGRLIRYENNITLPWILDTAWGEADWMGCYGALQRTRWWIFGFHNRAEFSGQQPSRTLHHGVKLVNYDKMRFSRDISRVKWLNG